MNQTDLISAYRVDTPSRTGYEPRSKASSILPLLISDHATPDRHDVALASTWLNALAGSRLELHAQHIVPLKKTQHEYTGWYEVLLRRRDNNGVLYRPSRFIALAEKYGLMPTIDRWVFAEALEWLDGFSDNTVRLSINLSAKTVECPQTVRAILTLLDRSHVDPLRLCFELTETAAVEDIGQAKRSLNALKRRGCAIALDDFGTGESSFAYLQYFDIDYLKIDAGFVVSLRTGPDGPCIAKAITRIAQHMGIPSIAEGVHNQASLEILQALGVEYGQGYFLGDVTPLSDVATSKVQSAVLA